MVAEAQNFASATLFCSPSDFGPRNLPSYGREWPFRKVARCLGNLGSAVAGAARWQAARWQALCLGNLRKLGRQRGGRHCVSAICAS